MKISLLALVAVQVPCWIANKTLDIAWGLFHFDGRHDC